MATPTFEITANSVFDSEDNAPFELNGATTVEAALEEISSFFEEENVKVSIEHISTDYTTEGVKAKVVGVNEIGENICVMVNMYEI